MYNGMNFSKENGNVGTQSADLSFYDSNGNSVLSLDTFGGIHLYKDDVTYTVDSHEKTQFLQIGKKVRQFF